jgi:hypothetical protein
MITSLRFASLILVCALSIAHAPWVHSQDAGADAIAAESPSAGALKIFDGGRKLIIVNGDSTSFGWWKILQRKTTTYFDGDRFIEVRAALQNVSGIGAWIDLKTGDPSAQWDKRVTPLIASKGDRPAIILAQQSLRGLYGNAEEGIRGEDDADRIAQGAEAYEAFAWGMLADGADAVFIAAQIYQEPNEPANGNDRLALKALTDRGVSDTFEGPDLWPPTRENHPAAYAADGVHPSNIVGDEIIAQLWFEQLLAREGLEVPEWSRDEVTNAMAYASAAR